MTADELMIIFYTPYPNNRQKKKKKSFNIQGIQKSLEEGGQGGVPD